MRLLPLLLLGCINGDQTLFEVTFEGRIDGPTDALLFIEAHHERKGEGVLEHPLGLVASEDGVEPGDVSLTWLHPIDEGTGVVIYAWQDDDGDGNFCSPETRDEMSAIVVFEEVEHRLTADLVLDNPCIGPERLLP